MRGISLVIATICIGLFAGSWGHAQEQALPDGVAVLYVQNAQTARFDGHQLILENVPLTTWFSNHPSRLAGSLSSADYLAEWKTGGAFAENPPNAALIYQAGEESETAVITLNSVEALDDIDFWYSIQVIKGEIPELANNVTLFVDPGGRTNPTGG